MQKLFFQSNSLDKNAIAHFHLNEDVLTQNAARGMVEYIFKHFQKNDLVVILCGGGNNGGDGLALARMLYGNFTILIILPSEPKSTQCKLELVRFTSLPNATNCIQQTLTQIPQNTKLFVDCLFGSGFRGELDLQSQSMLSLANAFDCYKIACDIPSGISKQGVVAKGSFRANITFSMGSHKLGLFSDSARDFVGEVQVVDLGIHQNFFESEDTPFWLLEKEDFKPPLRMHENTNKGTFGHLAVFCGEKVGASVLSSLSAISFGAGLVTLVELQEHATPIPYEIMSAKNPPKNTSAFAIGMGLGREINTQKLKLLTEALNLDIPKILDADIFYLDIFYETLPSLTKAVLTPHPKEFLHLLTQLNNPNLQAPKDVATLQDNRFTLAQNFSTLYPNIVLVLKGSNSIIAHNGELFINPLGTNALAKGGSGDVLSGLIGSLLAQGYSPLDSSIQGSLAHTLSAKKSLEIFANFALTPLDLIQSIKTLTK